MKIPIAVAALACGLASLSMGCGGGAHTSASLAKVDVLSVAPVCAPSAIAPGATSQCSAAVQGVGVYSSAVTWSASAGSITAGGLFTAPAAAGAVTIRATSTQDPAAAGTSVVSVQGATITSILVACTPATISPGATSQCTATVQGTGTFQTGVTWSASAGTISPAGVFTAPAAAGAVTVTATSIQDTKQSGAASLQVQTQVLQSAHVVMVLEENQSYDSVVGSAEWPNLNALLSNGALATHFYANTHPSIGNYFMLTTGQLLTNDDNSTTIWNVDNLARRMLAAATPFRIYAEGIPQGYLGGDTGPYLLRHNPFARLSDLASNPATADQHIWPFARFAADLASGNLPAFSFIVPDVNDDAHNGPPRQADTWLQSNVVIPLAGNPAFATAGDGILIVDFDEAASSDVTNGGGHVAVVFWGPNIKAGFTQGSSTVYQQQSLLRTVMEALGLPNPPGAAASAPSMDEFFIQH